MTVILREELAPARVVVGETDDARWPAGARFLTTALPRSLDDDRRLLGRLAEPAWAGICVCGIETPADIERVSVLLRVAEADRDRPPASLLILAVLDTARAALDLAAFHRPIPRLAGFLFDAKALAENTGAAIDSDLIADLRLRLPLAARASEVPAFLKVDEIGADATAASIRNGYHGLCLATS
ncbi:hypothetical protein [Rhizobium sp. C4]|uniref:hypothetical protein n=1 Tax=Rhizobium sp. C4 TaxID=1349800 RepID=UPI001E3AC379|nr:hypothetical protein [Rhizobium sp. C4]MCD2171362.1 hypothetical protein [Rhizobium sp. C4]